MLVFYDPQLLVEKHMWTYTQAYSTINWFWNLPQRMKEGNHKKQTKTNKQANKNPSLFKKRNKQTKTD